MKIGKFLFLILTALWVIGGVSAIAAPSEKIKCVVGYSIKGMPDVDPRDAEAALRVWAQELGDPYGFQVESTLYESVDKLIKDFVDKKLDFGIVNVVDYLRAASVIKAKPEMARSKNNKTSVKYVLLVQAATVPKGLAGLKNKNLSAVKANNLGLIFIGVHLMQAGFPDADRFFNAIQYKNKESQAILAVFFGQAEACLVTESAFSTMTELNPQVGQKLRIMAESPEIIEAVGFFRTDYPKAHKETAIKGMQSVKTHERGKQILLLFNVDRMDSIKESDLDSVKKILADYDRLKKKK